ncbi:MAG: ABC transporter ATP-binding protein [Chloroflexi bacterium]|nr:ABC transporter ATP-binding protein [Chloroflexota bacterium]
MPSIIEIKALKKQYNPPDGVVAVKGIDLDIKQGEIFSLLGPNGAGKTTTISMISGLLTPTEGDVLVGGHSISDAPLEAKQLIGVVPQEIALYPTLTARQNLNFFGKMYGLTGTALKERISAVLDYIGLTDRADDRIDEYSGGMKRRVNIGVGLLHRPQVLFLDEPTVGIDPQSRRSILDTVIRLNKEGMTVLYTTHYMEEAQELSHRVGIIDHGEIIALGTQDELTQMVGEEDSVILMVPEVTDAVTEQLCQVVGVSACKHVDGEVRLLAEDGRTALPDLITVINQAGLSLQSVEVQEPSLEAVFLHLTGRALRD